MTGAEGLPAPDRTLSGEIDAAVPNTLVRPPSEKQTAKLAARILVESQTGFIEPTRAERRALATAFAMAGKVLYGAAFDVVRLSRPVDLTVPTEIHAALDAVAVFEIKSTNRVSMPSDFSGYFFDLTTAELLVAQSLAQQYRFAFVNTITRAHIELSLNELFARARKIYPKWAVTF